MTQEVLPTLRDIDGVHGSFVVFEDGRVHQRDLPGVFDDAVLGEAAIHFARFYEALAAEGDAADWAVLRSAEHQLLLKRVDAPAGAAANTAFLAVLAARTANQASLKMATTLAARRLGPTLAAPRIAPAEPASTATAAFEQTWPSVPESAVPAQPPASQPPRSRFAIFRGRRYEIP